MELSVAFNVLRTTLGTNVKAIIAGNDDPSSKLLIALPIPHATSSKQQIIKNTYALIDKELVFLVLTTVFNCGIA